MRKFILTSPKFTGQATFGYDENGHLVFYHNEIPDKAVIIWMKRFLPLDEVELTTFKIKVHASVTEIPEDLTFDRFWNAYDKKINKKRTEPLFERLADAEKMQVIMCIKDYKDYCYYKHRGIADPEKYLRDRFFETDWNKVK